MRRTAELQQSCDDLWLKLDAAEKARLEERQRLEAANTSLEESLLQARETITGLQLRLSKDLVRAVETQGSTSTPTRPSTVITSTAPSKELGTPPARLPSTPPEPQGCPPSGLSPAAKSFIEATLKAERDRRELYEARASALELECSRSVVIPFYTLPCTPPSPKPP